MYSSRGLERPDAARRSSPSWASRRRPSAPSRSGRGQLGVGAPLVRLEGERVDALLGAPQQDPRGALAFASAGLTVEDDRLVGGQQRHPGEIGPAVILGRVDTARDGPAVFYRLRDLRPGDTITVRRLDGGTAVFAVSQVAQYSKLAFPTEAVFGALDHPALRLMTCGGTFDPIHRQHRGNVIAYAALTATTPG